MHYHSSRKEHGRAPVFDFRPTLEVLEDRCTFAADAFTGATAVAITAPQPVPVAQQGQLASASLVQSGQNPAAALVQSPSPTQQTLAVSVSSPTLVLQTLNGRSLSTQLTPATINALTSSLAQTQFPQTNANVLAFPGRVALPGTGVQSRVPTGSGPFAQPPGLFLPGGGNEELFTAPRANLNARAQLSLVGSETPGDNSVAETAILEGTVEAVEQPSDAQFASLLPWLFSLD